MDAFFSIFRDDQCVHGVIQVQFVEGVQEVLNIFVVQLLGIVPLNLLQSLNLPKQHLQHLLFAHLPRQRRGKTLLLLHNSMFKLLHLSNALDVTKPQLLPREHGHVSIASIFYAIHARVAHQRYLNT